MRQSGDTRFPTHPGGAAVKWDRDQLAEIIDNDDLHVAPLRDDGATFGTPTWILKPGSECSFLHAAISRVA